VSVVGFLTPCGDFAAELIDLRRQPADADFARCITAEPLCDISRTARGEQVQATPVRETAISAEDFKSAMRRLPAGSASSPVQAQTARSE
jgi:hypothetical protein